MESTVTLASISIAQLRAARAFLDWSMGKAAAAAGVTRRTVIRLEREPGYKDRQPKSLVRLVEAYRRASPAIVFIEGGVRPGAGTYVEVQQLR